MKKHPYLFLFIAAVIVGIGLFMPSSKPNLIREISDKWSVNYFNLAGNQLKLEHDYVFGFQTNGTLWLRRQDKQGELYIFDDFRDTSNDKYSYGEYEFFNRNDSLFIDVYEFDDPRLKGVYHISIDTLERKGKNHLVRLSLKSKENELDLLVNLIIE